MKKIFALIFVVTIVASLAVVCVVPASAAYSDGHFVVDSVLADDADTVTLTDNYGYVDVRGQYAIMMDFFGRNVQGTFTLFEAPLGYYIVFCPNLDSLDSLAEVTYVFDRVDVGVNEDGLYYFYGYFNGEVTRIAFGADRVQAFILPYLPSFIVDSPQDILVRSADSVEVIKSVGAPMIPAYVVPDQSLPRIFEVWHAVSEWVSGGLASVAGVFYVAGQLTLIGTLAVISVGIALIFLLIAFIRKFLFLRG